MSVRISLKHGTLQGYRTHKCRCVGCTTVWKEYRKAYQAERRRGSRQGERRTQFEDMTGPTPIQSCHCSLAGVGVDLPCQVRFEIKPFSEMIMLDLRAPEREWMTREKRKL